MKTSLRLAVDARTVVGDTRGIGRYARAVLRRLVVRDDVVLTLLIPELFAFLRRASLERVLRSDRFWVRSRASEEVDILWHPANGTFFASRAPSVATIHDAVPFRYPSTDPQQRERDQHPFVRSAETAARIIAVSHFGASEIHDVFGVPRDRIDVIYHGVDPSFAPGPPEPPPSLHAGEYFLFVGDPTGEPRKNFSMLYQAYRAAWPDGGPPIAVAGAHTPSFDGVVHAGHFNDDLGSGTNASLRGLYRGALALLIPSYHETFGMPMIEAMACATPVIAADASCLPEIGGDAALFIPPDDVGAWSKALRRVAEDAALREDLAARGPVRARAFDWEESARRHLSLFRAVCEQR